jgi:chaperonin GroES
MSKKVYAVGDNSLTDDQKKYAGQDVENNIEFHKNRIENEINAKEEVDINELIKNFAWIPHQDRCVIYPDPPEYVLPSGIIIPATSQERPQSGVIVALGSELSTMAKVIEYQERILSILDKDFKPTEDRSKKESKPGDRVLFGKFAGMEIEISGVKYLILRFADIISTLR